MSEIIKLKGSNYFRVKIAYSLLLNRPIEISEIRVNDINPGLTEYEISFLKLIEKITNGTNIELSKTGTQVRFYPGVITNNYGDEFEFECHVSRSIPYYLEGILPISMYGKESLNCILYGVTNDNDDMSVDSFKSTTCALVQKLVFGDTISLDIKRRGVYPLGGGMVRFKCPIVMFLNNFDWLEEGKIKRVRGLAFTTKISASMSTRMVDACRGTFNNFLPDVWISVDNNRDKSIPVSPGYGLSLVAETTEGFYYSADITNNIKENSQIKQVDTNITPEDLARKCALGLLEDLFYVYNLLIYLVWSG
jgi:RNA 3'-terminal phosphate cyclase-like protein